MSVQNGSKRFVNVADDLAEMDREIADNPEQYPNGTVCTAEDTGIVYVANGGVWEIAGTGAPPP